MSGLILWEADSGVVFWKHSRGVYETELWIMGYCGIEGKEYSSVFLSLLAEGKEGF